MSKSLPSFQFLYYVEDRTCPGGYNYNKHRTKVIRAQNIKWACRKFMRNRPEKLMKIDYEVKINGDDFVDISDMEGVKDFI